MKALCKILKTILETISFTIKLLLVVNWMKGRYYLLKIKLKKPQQNSKIAKTNMDQIQKYCIYLDYVIYLQNKKQNILRAQGYFCMSKFNLAKQDLEVYQENLLEKASLYNKLLCYGIIKYKDNELEQSKIEYSFAHKLLPNKIEPLFYSAIIKIKKYCSSVEKSNEENRIKLLKDGLDLLELALKNFLQSNMLFYKGILHFALGNLEKSSLDLEQAIEKSEDNQAQHYYVRGLLHCQLQLFKQAVKRFFNLFKFRLKSFRILSKQMQIINFDG